MTPFRLLPAVRDCDCSRLLSTLLRILEGKKAKKKKKAATLREKKALSYGVIFLDQISPPIPVESRKPIEIDMTMDEALKLHLGLLQALTELNRLDRRSPKSRARGIRFALYPDQRRMMVQQGSVKDNSAPR